jgi:CBS domain-containing protein
MEARDLMTKNPKTCGPADTLRSVLAIMRDEDCGIVPITEGNGQGLVVGVVTDRDIALRLGETDERPSNVRASEVMSSSIVSVEPGADLDEVSGRMKDAQVRRILVCENGRLLGVIATADLAREAKAKETGRVIEKISEPTGRPRP